MIFVTVGSQKFQFDRLLKAIDRQIETGKITEVVFAQIGVSGYSPQNYNYKQYLDRDEFALMQDKADIIITHGGTGAIVGAIKKGKKVIVVPRRKKYGEHVDDHQIQMVRQFSNQNFILECEDCDNIWKFIEECKEREFGTYVSNTERIIESIEKFINIK